jgi:hypothetical protein
MDWSKFVTTRLQGFAGNLLGNTIFSNTVLGNMTLGSPERHGSSKSSGF